MLGAFDRLAVFAAETVCDGHFERRVRGRGFDCEHVRIGYGAESRGARGQRIAADQDVERVFGPHLLDFQVAAVLAHAYRPSFVPVVDVDQTAVAARLAAELFGNPVQVVDTELVAVGPVAVGFELPVGAAAAVTQDQVAAG